MSAAQATSAVEHLKRRIADESESSRKVEALILGLAEMIKTSSNDQNVQRLSRELRAAVADLAAAAAGRVHA